MHTILYIEDNEANRQLVELIIARREDLTLLTAVTGEEGLKVAKEICPDIVLLDLSLPDIHGLEVLQLLKITEQTNKIPVISLSGSKVGNEGYTNSETGFVASLTKPVDITALYDTIDKVIAENCNS